MMSRRIPSLSIGTIALAIGMCIVFNGVVFAADKPAEGEDAPVAKAAEPKAPGGETPDPVQPVAEPEVEAEGPAGKAVELSGMVVTATRTKGRTFRLTRFITLVDETNFQRMGLNVAVDALEKQIGTWVEHRTGSTGDAVIRGLSGGNILALVDGCSLSSFWGEGGFAGDDMYGKVDPETLERIEVVRGPGSVLYGSQALGAVINFITRSSPADFTDGVLVYGGRSKLYFTGGNNGFTFRNEAYLAHERIRVLVGSTVRQLGDMRGGGDVGRLNPTSSQENNFDAKVDFRLAKNHTFTLAHQNVYRDPTYRYYRPTQANVNIRHGYMGWYHGEEFEGPLDSVDVKVYHQYKADRRIWLPDDSDPKVGTCRTKTTQIEAQGTLRFEAMGQHALTGGVSYHYDWGDSPDDEQFTYTKASWPVGPGGKRMDSPFTFWTNYAAFVQDEYEPTETLKVTGSVRVDYFDFETDPYTPDYYPSAYLADPSAFGFVLKNAQVADDLRYNETVVTGGLGLNWAVAPWMSAVTSFTVGFRQWPPKFGVTQHGNGIYAPSTDPATIYSYNFEAGAKFQHRNFDGSAVLYFNTWDGFVEWHPGTFNGQNWYDWNNNGFQDAGENVLVRDATGMAEVYGVELQGTLHLRDGLFGKGWIEGFSFMGGFAMNYGVDYTTRHPDNPAISEDDDWKYEPIRHTHPMRAILSARWEEPVHKNVWASFTADMVDRYTRIPTGRLSGDVGYYEDPADASQGMVRNWGLPGYSVCDLMAGFKATDAVSFTLGCKNLFDRKYRRAHSRTWEMGRSLEFGVEVKY